MTRSRSKGRPTKTLVTREKIADAALTIVGAEGYEKLTMSRIAREIGVGTSALYNHVSGKEELITLVEDAVMEQVDCGPLYAALGVAPTSTPYKALSAWATSYRDVCARHTPLVQFIAVTPISGAPRTMEMYELVVQVFKKAGLSDERIMPRIVALESFIYGSAYDVHAPEEIFDIPPENALEAPHLVRAREAFRPHSNGAEAGNTADRNPYADESFRLGLEALLADITTAECPPAPTPQGTASPPAHW